MPDIVTNAFQKDRWFNKLPDELRRIRERLDGGDDIQRQHFFGVRSQVQAARYVCDQYSNELNRQGVWTEVEASDSDLILRIRFADESAISLHFAVKTVRKNLQYVDEFEYELFYAEYNGEIDGSGNYRKVASTPNKFDVDSEKLLSEFCASAMQKTIEKGCWFYSEVTEPLAPSPFKSE